MAYKNYWKQYSDPDYKFYIFAAVILILAAAIVFTSYKSQTQQLSCQYKYWFDSSNNVCGYKQFCGVYMYQGLQTFDDLSSCETALNSTTTATSTATAPTTGDLVIAFKGDGEKLSGLGTATSLIVSVNSVDISDGLANDTNSSWTNVYSGSKSLDIINYQNSSAIIAEQQFVPASYHKIKFSLNDSQIKIYYFSLGIYNKTFSLLATPSEVVVPYDFSINAGQKTVLTFDFDVSNSVIRQPDSNGVLQYTFKPLIVPSQTVLGSNDAIPNSQPV